MERATLIEMIETGGCAGLDVAILEALGLEYNGEVLDSLDAAVALVERVRPGWKWGIDPTNGDDPSAACLVEFIDGFVYVKSMAHAPTPAAALVAALLKASEP